MNYESPVEAESAGISMSLTRSQRKWKARERLVHGPQNPARPRHSL